MSSPEHRQADVCTQCQNTICIITCTERRIIDIPTWYGKVGEPFRARVRECDKMLSSPSTPGPKRISV